MKSTDYIWKIIMVKIDRKLWSLHPKWWFEYMTNYWFVPDTVSWDWEELDVYILWVNDPIDEFIWKCIAVIHRTNDNDDKLIVTQENLEFSNDEIIKLTNFQEKFFKSIILR